MTILSRGVTGKTYCATFPFSRHRGKKNREIQLIFWLDSLWQPSNKCIGFTICFFCSDIIIDKYVHRPMLNTRFITLPVVNCRSFASEIEDFEFAVYNRRTRVEANFLNSSSGRRLYPRKSHCSTFRFCSRMSESFILLLVLLARKLVPYLPSEIHACHPQTVLLIASFWSDAVIIDQLLFNGVQSIKVIYLHWVKCAFDKLSC